MLRTLVKYLLYINLSLCMCNPMRIGDSCPDWSGIKTKHKNFLSLDLIPQHFETFFYNNLLS